MVDLALAQLDQQALAGEILIRADGAGATHELTTYCREAELLFSFGFDLSEPVRQAIIAVPEAFWINAIRVDGTERDHSHVVEITDRVDLSAWSAGSRLIARRTKLLSAVGFEHDGAALGDHRGVGYERSNPRGLRGPERQRLLAMEAAGFGGPRGCASRVETASLSLVIARHGGVVEVRETCPVRERGWASDATHSRVAVAGRLRSAQQPGDQPHRAVSRAKLPVTEPQHPGFHAKHDRFDRVGQLASRGRDRDQLLVQRNQPPRRGRAHAPGARPRVPQPPTHGSRRSPKLAGDPRMPGTTGGKAQRLADHLRTVAAPRNRPRGTEHVRRAAPATTRPPRRDRAHPVEHPHLPRPRVPPRPKPPS